MPPNSLFDAFPPWSFVRAEVDSSRHLFLPLSRSLDKKKVMRLGRKLELTPELARAKCQGCMQCWSMLDNSPRPGQAGRQAGGRCPGLFTKLLGRGTESKLPMARLEVFLSVIQTGWQTASAFVQP